ncbi:unnamed protein product, partial [Prorocentrum cordatum]
MAPQRCNEEASSAAPAEGRGIRRRVEDLEGATPCGGDARESTDLLRRRWAMGSISSPDVIKFAKAAASQGAQNIGAYAGTSNLQSKLAFRAVCRAIGTPARAPQISWAELKNTNGDVIFHPFVDPIDTLEAWYRKGPLVFNQRITGEDGETAQFWHALRDHPTYKCNAPRISSIIVPLGLHGDAAPTSKADGLFTLQFNRLLGHGDTIATRDIVTVFKKSDLDLDMFEQMVDRIAWSFNALFKGVMPALQHNGVPHPEAGRTLCYGRNFATIQMRGDWEYYSDFLHLNRWNSAECCYLCGATLAGGDMRLSNFFKIISFRFEGIMVDILHCLDLGVSSHLIANVLVEIMVRGQWGPNRESHMQGLVADIKQWYRSHKLAHKLQGELVFARLRTQADWPKLKATAAATRCLVPYAADLAKRYNSGSEHDRLRLAACELLARFYDLAYENDMFPPQPVKDEMAQLARAFMNVYGRLSVGAIANGIRAWKMTPKFHMFVHMSEHQNVINPRFYWTYSDEDLQRIMKEIAKSLHPSSASDGTECAEPDPVDGPVAPQSSERTLSVVSTFNASHARSKKSKEMLRKRHASEVIRVAEFTKALTARHGSLQKAFRELAMSDRDFTCTGYLPIPDLRDALRNMGFEFDLRLLAKIFGKAGLDDPLELHEFEWTLAAYVSESMERKASCYFQPAASSADTDSNATPRIPRASSASSDDLVPRLSLEDPGGSTLDRASEPEADAAAQKLPGAASPPPGAAGAPAAEGPGHRRASASLGASPGAAAGAAAARRR